MRHHGDVVRRRHCADLQQLRQPTAPHDVRLDDIDVAALDQLAEPVAAVFVLAGREFHGGMSAFQEGVPVEVVGGEAFFPPVDVQMRAFRDELDRVGHVERHVAVHAKREVGTHGLAVRGQEGDVCAHSGGAFARTVGEGHFCGGEAEGGGGGRGGTGAVEVEAGAGCAADELVDGLVADFAEEIPEGKVDDGDYGDGEAFAAVEHGAGMGVRLGGGQKRRDTYARYISSKRWFVLRGSGSC